MFHDLINGQPLGPKIKLNQKKFSNFSLNLLMIQKINDIDALILDF